MPQGCARTPEGQGADALGLRKAAVQRLDKKCHPAIASWACFYAAHNAAMAWGTGLASKDQVKALYQRVCLARCPAAPERCYRELACQRYQDHCRQ
jgi:hypothetical protein